MGIRRATPPAAFVVLLVLVLGLPGTTALGSSAQPSVPLPSTGQVIAHGVDTLPGTVMTWRLGVVTAAPGATAEFGTFDTGFAIGYQQAVITTRLPSGESTFLPQGQATFHAGGSTLRVASASGVAVPYLDIDLTTDALDPGASWIGDPFTAPSGTHAIRLTSDSMKASENGTFVPDNDLPYMVYAFAGTLQVTDEEGGVTTLAAEEVLQVSGTASLLADASTGARWMVASIGPQVTVPPLPTPVIPVPGTSTGSLIVQLLRCPEGTDPLIAPTECGLSDIVWDITLSPQGNDDPAKARTLVNDSVDIGAMTYRFMGLEPGTWVIRPDMSGMTPEQRIEITGDVVPLGGVWGVEIAANAEADIDVYLIDPPAPAGTGTLTIEMYDCPPGINPMSDPSPCTLATDVPNVEVSRITQSEMIVYNTLWDAVSPRAGVFILQDVPSGLFMLIPEDGGLWSADAVSMGGDAFWDTGFWEVTVPEDGGSAYVPIYYTPAGPPEPTQVTDIPQGTGRLWITQVDCPAGTGDPLAEPGCMPSEAPWDVTITNADTGETWTLYENGTLAITGSWEFTLPAGNYLIDVSYDPSWQVIYETFATVSEGDLSEVVVYSIPFDEP